MSAIAIGPLCYNCGHDNIGIGHWQIQEVWQSLHKFSALQIRDRYTLGHGGVGFVMGGWNCQCNFEKRRVRRKMSDI